MCVVRGFSGLCIALFLFIGQGTAADIPFSPVQPIIINGPNGLVPIDINDAGEVIGAYPFAPSVTHGFFWSPTRGFIDLGALDQGGRSQAEAINNCGEIAGWATDAEGTFESLKAVRWNASLTIEDVTPLIGPMVLRDINDAGHLLGSYNSNAYFWSPATGTLDIGGISDTITDPFALNDRDEITGAAYTAEYGAHAFRWSITAGVQDLHPPGSQWSEGADIDDKGNVVGYYYPPTGGLHAALWRRNGQFVDLNPMGITDVDHPSAAVGISDNGYIIGIKLFPNSIAEYGFVKRRNQPAQLLTMDGSDVLMTRAFAVNRRGQVVGTVSLTDGTYLGVIWNVGHNNHSSDADEDARKPRCRD